MQKINSKGKGVRFHAMVAYTRSSCNGADVCIERSMWRAFCALCQSDVDWRAVA
jgi:hypothetical protein